MLILVTIRRYFESNTIITIYEVEYQLYQWSFIKSMYVHLNVGIFQLFGTNFFNFARFRFRFLKNNPYNLKFCISSSLYVWLYALFSFAVMKLISCYILFLKRKSNIFPHTTSNLLSDGKLKNQRLNWFVYYRNKSFLNAKIFYN